MGRTRAIKPGIWHDAEFVEIENPWTRLLLFGLGNYADKAGRLKDKPKQIKMDVFPADNVDVDVCLDELASLGWITRYQVDGEAFIEIKNWNRHQSPHPKEPDSVIPDIPEEAVKRNGEQCNSTASRGKVKSEVNRNREKGIGRREKEEQLRKLFETRFWKIYPRKVGKKAAYKAFSALEPDERVLNSIATDIKARLDTGLWQDWKYIPHPSTYLRQRRWEDELPEKKSSGKVVPWVSKEEMNEHQNRENNVGRKITEEEKQAFAEAGKKLGALP